MNFIIGHKFNMNTHYLHEPNLLEQKKLYEKFVFNYMVIRVYK